jgi:hypothetical protein
VLTAEVQHIKRKKLTMTSRLHKDTKVYIRHTAQKGWTTLEMMKVFVSSPYPTPELKKQLEGLLAIHREVIDTADKIQSLRERAGEYRMRMDELQDQIISLKKVKSAASLQKNLTDKMKDISNRVQQTTIDIVDNQEKLMLAKVRFQDQLAEMTLPDVAANLAVKP